MPATTRSCLRYFCRSFSIGNLSAANTTTVTVFNTFAGVRGPGPEVDRRGDAGLQFVAIGVYNRATNTFTASSIDVVN